MILRFTGVVGPPWLGADGWYGLQSAGVAGPVESDTAQDCRNRHPARLQSFPPALSMSFMQNPECPILFLALVFGVTNRGMHRPGSGLRPRIWTDEPRGPNMQPGQAATAPGEEGDDQNADDRWLPSVQAF